MHAEALAKEFHPQTLSEPGSGRAEGARRPRHVPGAVGGASVTGVTGVTCRRPFPVCGSPRALTGP